MLAWAFLTAAVATINASPAKGDADPKWAVMVAIGDAFAKEERCPSLQVNAATLAVDSQN